MRCVGRFKVRYLAARPRKDGTVAYYWTPKPSLRAAGFEIVRLPSNEVEAHAEAKKLNDRLDRWYAGEPLEAPQFGEWTVAALDDVMQRDHGFKRLAPRSQRDYIYAIKPVLAWIGHHRVEKVTRRAVMTWLGAQIKERGAANTRNTAAALRRLMTFGRDQGWIKDNPATETKLAAPPKRSRIWSVEERDKFCLTAIDLGLPSMSLAVMLGWCIGQRPADLRKLAWSSYDGRTIALRQAKTKADIRVPCLPELRVLLDLVKRESPVMVVSEVTKRPYGESAFQHTFARVRTKAGLPDDLQYRDLRRTLATALGAAGCTVGEIQAITGHKTLGILTTYMQTDDRFAKAAMDKLERARLA